MPSLLTPLQARVLGLLADVEGWTLTGGGPLAEFPDGLVARLARGSAPGTDG